MTNNTELHENGDTAEAIESTDATEEVEASTVEQTEGDTEPTEDVSATDPEVAAVATVSAETRNWSTLAHLSGLVLFAGIPSFLGPLVVWLIKKDDPYVEVQAKEALNFNISFLVYAIVATISLIGILALPVIFVTWLVLVVVAGIRSADGEAYQYPLTMRFIR